MKAGAPLTTISGNRHNGGPASEKVPCTEAVWEGRESRERTVARPAEQLVVTAGVLPLLTLLHITQYYLHILRESSLHLTPLVPAERNQIWVKGVFHLPTLRFCHRVGICKCVIGHTTSASTVVTVAIYNTWRYFFFTTNISQIHRSP